MIVIDVGNTDTVIGIYYKKKLKKTIRIYTRNLNHKLLLYTLINKHNYFKFKLDNKFCIISSVVPSKNKVINSFFKSYLFKVKNININNIPRKIKFNYSTNQLGADRIANTFSAINKYGKNIIIIDFGTATTFDLVKNYIYEGGVIAPGINVSYEALINNAEKLNKISIKRIDSIIGKNTANSMQSGFYWGYVSLINGIINKIIKENKFNPKIILTGGLAKIFKKEIMFMTYYEPNLTLEGLYLIGLENHD